MVVLCSILQKALKKNGWCLENIIYEGKTIAAVKMYNPLPLNRLNPGMEESQELITKIDRNMRSITIHCLMQVSAELQK